ncbi:glycosyltransferase [Clostridium fermenticellae]|uniref:Glycosyltransferase n=1 Tax=Clostridium fermenticellae TaxID=2068654 RepID=A0A386H259_9CLOT|nr:glycosyltransferase family 2 protein [Clostridium fermenticellae]AYD39787.1 glycosyltransferase [Clostridium fermenticellae]
MADQISLCMIVKNEEKDLPRCLESIKNLVDEIIIVDTGSTDSTIDIAKNYGAKVYYFKWCDDFSRARNESLKYATKDWILIMDADDEFAQDDKQKFNELKDKLDVSKTYFFETVCYFGMAKGNNISINLNPRLFKNNYGYSYKGVIHNQLINSDHPINGICESIRIYHYGYLDNEILNKKKNERNIKILKKEIEKDPQNKFNYFNIGTEYSSINDEKKALENYYKAYDKFNPSTGFAPKLIEKIVISNYNLKRFDTSIEFIETGIKYYPEFTDLYYLKGLVLEMQHKPTMAIEVFEKCLKLGEAPFMLKCMYGTGTFKASYELSKIYLYLKDYDMAYKYSVDTLRFKSDYLVPLYNITHILKKKNTPIDKFKQIIENFFHDIKNQYQIIADLFYMEGYYDIALEYIDRYSSENTPEDLAFFKIKCLIRSKKFEECIKYTEGVSEENLYYFQISMYRIICFLVLGKYDFAHGTIRQFYLERNDHNKKIINVYNELISIFEGKETSILSEDENEKEYTSAIFEVFEILLANMEFDKFEKSLELLNLISDKSVLLQLGKLYYKYGYRDMAKKEILRSIKMFDLIDSESLDILKSCI